MMFKIFKFRKKTIRSPQLEKKKKKERIRKIIFLAICVFVIVFVPFYITSLSFLNIQSIQIKGNNITGSGILQSIIDKNISGRYFGLYPKSNIFIFPSNTIKKEILSDIKRIKNVDITRTNFHNIEVTVTERNPHALWCKGEDPDQLCFFVDDTGFVFAEAPTFSDNVYLKYFGVINTESPIGQRYQDEQDFKNIDSFVSNVKKIGVVPKKILTENQDITITLESGGDIMFKKGNYSKTVSDLNSFLSDDPFKSDKTALSRILYIDMRFGNKIFYKFKD